MGMNPGIHRWPTLRYFNKATGLGGAAYPKRTKRDLHVELKDPGYLRDFIEEMANTTLCPITLDFSCDEQETAFLKKWKDRPHKEQKQEETRLQKLWAGEVQFSQRHWLGRRLRFMSKLVKAGE